MGRWPGFGKTTVEECGSLDVAKMARAGVFKNGPAYTWNYRWGNHASEQTASFHLTSAPYGGLAVRLTYTVTNRLSGEKAQLDYSVEITSTRCHFGGRRFWFHCPIVKDGTPCHRRVGKLYLPPGARYFGCRICYDLTYESCQEHNGRIDALRRMVGL